MIDFLMRFSSKYEGWMLRATTTTIVSAQPEKVENRGSATGLGSGEYWRRERGMTGK
uniref:Uncharacterized protein n=1 Tax=Nelumbo nucifera TaxID=4432 RepID=A0A822ZGA2_NELNU|nr:TPA_asm: hypothetical protein HUJ06_002392 [Nelumbo nucifera]